MKRFPLVYLLHLALATVGSGVLGILPWLPLAIPNIVLNTPNPLDRLVDPPYFLLPIAAGLFLGYVMLRRLPSKAAMFAWVLPLLNLVYSIATWKSYSGLSYWQDVWANFFSSSCGASECLYEFLVAAPFYTSVAYSVGAFWGHRRGAAVTFGAKGVIRAVGVVNLFMALAGLVIVAVGLYHFPPSRMISVGAPSLDSYLLPAVNGISLLALLCGAIWVLRLDRRGLVLCNVVMGLQLGHYALALGLYHPMLANKVPSALRGFLTLLGAAANLEPLLPLAALRAGYAVLVVIVLNGSYRRLDQPAP